MWDRLNTAIKGSDTKLVRFYLEQEPELVYELNYQEETLLHHAAKDADSATIAELLSSGAKPDSSDRFGWTPMHEACKSKNEAAVALFIKFGMNLNLKTSKQENPLHIAARHNACSIMARLLEAGARIDDANNNGNTALHLAAQRGFSKAVEVLLAAGADLRTRNLLGLTALHMTAIRGHFKCADILLSNRANPLQLDDSGKSFLDIAEMCGKQLYILHVKTSLVELEEKSQSAITEEIAAVVKKPTLTDFYNDKALQPANKFTDSCKRIANDLVTGHGAHNYSNAIVKRLEASLWFAVFPFMLFILWKGFASGALPAIITLNLNLGNLASTEFVQAFANSMIVFIASFLMVTTENESISFLHFFKDLREAVHFRVIHLFLIEIFYYEKLAINAAFMKEFAIFWVWFVMLYAFSYLLWWASTHTSTATAKSDTSEICFAHD